MRQTVCARRVPSWYDRRRHLGGGHHAQHEAEGVRQPARRRGRVAARRARAADGDAGDWDLVARRGASRAASHGVVPVRQLGFVEGQNVAIEYIDELFYRALADGIREAPCFGPSTTTTAPISTRL